MKETFFPENKSHVININGYSKHDIDLINKYCSKFGYKPDFNNNTIYDGSKCHTVHLIKKNGLLYAIDNQHGLEECINDNFVMYNRMKKTCDKNGWNKFFEKNLGDAFGLVSLKHTGGL